ncbi:polymorphic toxin type 44 domain-containing protein [uncultured Campylobacter sp.]|uniref:polymorphic toxin type 44 domain-containing protein n=1 Tax=uncultured Campylobacter sp. TaxID=218934 RepID=UPI0026361336|nr:polymorphic toxin type 44 domain-containing protein [uncultured Campylobacter sp.]
MNFNGEIPAGVNIEANIKEALDFRASHSVLETYYYFYLKVKNRGEWDYKYRDIEAKQKNQPSKYEDFGNWHYGVIGTALGIPKEILLAGAGAAQVSSMMKDSNFLLNFVWSWLQAAETGDFGYYDDPKDQAQILAGIQAYKKNFPISPMTEEELCELLSAFPDDTLSNELKNYLKEIYPYKDFFNSINIVDPLALDLNGDGKIGISPAPNGGAYFDHNGDGVSHRSSWISKEDVILAYDRNGNGNIDDGGELFGNFTQIKDKDGNQRLAKDGYEALKEFDSNNDGLIDNKDDKFKDLKIWQDANSNGISDEGELKSLDELGIASLSLNHNEVNEDLGGGNTLSLKGSYIKTDGTAHSMGDLNFNVDTINSKFKDGAPLSSEDMARANIKGFGLLRDLRSAAALNKDLAAALDSYSRLSTKEEQLKALPALIKAWSETAVRSTDGNSNAAGYEVSLKGVKLPSNVNLGAGSNINVDADGNVINSGNPNARRLSLTPSQYQALLNSSNSIDESLLKEFESIKYKIKVIDAFTGSKTAELYYISNDDIKAIIKNTNETYDKILNYSYASLLAQTRLKGYADLISLDMISVPNDTAAGGASGSASGGANISAKPKYDFRLNFTKVIDKFKEINLSDPKKAFVDLAEFATLFQSKKEFTAGLSLLAEFAYGANKRGVLSEYIAAIGQETQNKLDIATITSNSSGTNANDMMVGSEGADKLYGGDGNDTIYGGEGNDAINGQGGNDIIYGGDGDDHAFGEWGNDTFEGGKGNDRLEGAWGDDTYIFGRGDGADTIYDFVGNDTIKFKEGIGKENITFQRVANDLVLKYGENDTVRINNQFGGGAIEQIALASGEYITASKINKIIEDLNAYATNNGMSNISMDDMKNNPDIMQMFASGWGN